MKVFNKDDWELALVANDFHFPYQDQKAVDLFLLFVRTEKPDVIFLNGDIVDCWEISRFEKPPNQGRTLVKEFEITNDFLRQLRKLAPKAKIYYIFGNHEYRFRSYLITAPGLYGLKGYKLRDQLCFEETKIEVIDNDLRENHMKYGGLYVGHWDVARKHSGQTAKGLVEDKGVCLIQGHCHRLGSYYKRLFEDNVLVGYENGCLCNINPDWVEAPNWQLGFSVVYRKRDKDRFHLYQIPIVDYQFFYGNKHYIL